VFPADSIWNTPVDKLPLYPHSASYIRSIDGNKTLHPDFARDPKSGIPYNVVSGNPRKIGVEVPNGESDQAPVPIPANPSLEGGGGQGDSHLIVVDTDDCRLYELFAAKRLPGGGWHAESAAHFDLRSNALRPDGWTSADAAGLPIFPGLVRYNEVASGQIRHAVRMTLPKTNDSYVWPGRHYASHLDGEQYPPMGQRFRLKASYDISSFDPMVQVILQALKTYGMMLADNGSAWFITGATDPRWDDNILSQLQRVTGADLEAVDVSSLETSPNSALATDPNASNRASVAFSATPVFDLSVAPTQSVTLTGDVTASTIANLSDGQTVSFLICQDSTGGHAFNWPPNVRGGMQVGTLAGTCSAQTFVSDGSKLYATTPGVANM